MEDYSSQPARTSIRGAMAKIAKEESGDTTRVDYVSHPLDKAAMPEDPFVDTGAVTKKSTKSAVSTRAKALKKPIMPRKNATPRPRKRPAGKTTTTANSESAVKKKVEDQFAASVSNPPQNESIPTHSNGDDTQQLVNLQDLVGKVDTNLDNTDSDLSELERTPERPEFLDRPFKDRPVKGVKDKQQPGTMVEQAEKKNLQTNQRITVSSLLSDPVDSVYRESRFSSSADHGTASQANDSVVSQEQLQIVTHTHLAAPGSEPVISPITPRSIRQSQRSKVQPIRFGELIPTPAVDSKHIIGTDADRELAATDDSPIARKVSRNAKAIGAAKSARRKTPVSPKKLSADDLANDVPVTVKVSRKRKVETPAADATLRKKTTKSKTAASTELPTASKVPRNTPVSRRKKKLADTPILKIEASRSLLTSPQSQSDYLEASGQHIDPQLLELSKALTHREPLESKPKPRGKPDVWAPGRQELCETLPYYKSAHSGCYTNENNVYAFMFDSAGIGREYMDQDVIISRMGGGMDTDPKTGVVAQVKDHDIDAAQPRSLLNNIAHRNPLAIICGNKNSCAPTSMPHRYCVLDWFKPTHIWAEMIVGKKGLMPTIRYRFERLDTSTPPWYAPATDSVPEIPSELVLPSQTCSECLETCPQIYLFGWVCTNPKCVALWKLSDGQIAPYSELDYHPAFLLHRTKWEREDPPFNLNPGVPDFGQHIGDNLTYINTRGVVCPQCGRCNPRYKFTHWQCDTVGCDWRLTPNHHLVTPQSLTHQPWDMTSDGPTLIKAQTAPVVKTQVRYRSNYKLLRYTIDGVAGSVIVAKANKKVNSEPGGPDDMFQEIQSSDIGLERRMLRATSDGESKTPAQQHIGQIEPTGDASNTAKDEQAQVSNESFDDEPDDDHKAEVGNRMTAFGMNFGMPYKFIASGDSRSFDDAPTAIRAAWSRLNFAQREFVNEPAGYQDFNEELVFAYMQGQNIKYHDDGEKGLGPRIATLSLGAGATMTLRVKAKYHSQVSKTGVFTYEEPLPLPVLESSTQGFKPKAKGADKGKSADPLKDKHTARVAASEELQKLKDAGNTAEFRKRSKELATELKLRRVQAQPLLSFHLTHGDIVLMEGEEIQKFLEHQVDPCGNLRFALTCRTILEDHLTPDQLPKYKVGKAEVYDGSGIREKGDDEPLVWN